MIQAMGGQPPIYQPPQSPLPVFRPGNGGGNHSRIMQFLQGQPLNQNQIARMANGRTPGGFGGAFSQLNPAVLMQLAQLIQGAGNGQLQGGQPPVYHPGGQHGQPPMLVHPILGGGLNHPRQRPGDGGGIVPPRLRRLAGMHPVNSYPVR